MELVRCDPAEGERGAVFACLNDGVLNSQVERGEGAVDAK
jgi:hypothetical protein